MKVVTYVLIAVLVAVLAFGAYFFFFMYKPMETEFGKMKAGQPEFDKARKELARYKDREKAEAAWTGPAADALKKGLAKEIADGKAEVVVAGSRIVVNIAEPLVYTPHSVTFAKDSQPFLTALAGLLKDMKDKEIFIGNTTAPAVAQGKGRKRVPARDARTLASGRTLELVKALVKYGAADEQLIAAAYPGKIPDRGFKLKGEKVVIVISAPAVAEAAPAAPARPETRPAAATKQTATPAPVSQIKTIPISTTPPPKKVQ